MRAWLAFRLDPRRENRVVAFAPNTIALVVATAAVASLGVPWVGIDPARDADTVRAQTATVAPTVLLVDSTLPGAPRIAAQARDLGALVLDLALLPLTAPVPAADTGWPAPPFVALGFTSGTTGVPKLFRRTRRTENQRLRYLRDQLGFGPRDTYLVTSPLAHASGHVWANAALSLGATVILGAADPAATTTEIAAEIVTEIARHRVSTAFLVPPTVDAFIAAALAAPDTDLTSLRALLTGGRHLSRRTIRDTARRLGPVLHAYYATTETGINTMAGPADLAAAPLTAGRPMPGVHLRVIDPVTRADRPLGEVGQLAVSSPLNLDGYVGATAELLEREGRGYVLTSDYGRLDELGRLFILGRGDHQPGMDALDVVGIESALKELPEVRDVCVVRRPRAGEDTVDVVAALIPAHDSDSAVSIVRARLGELLANFPGTPLVVETAIIPYNTAGKVDVRALAALLDAAPLPAS